LTPDFFKLIIEITILLIGSLMLVLLLAAVGRRILHGRKYQKLDVLRAVIKSRLIELTEANGLDQCLSDLRSSPKSIKWRAAEDVLLALIDEEQRRETAKELLGKLGYISYYEGKLESRNIITKSAAIDKLGKMQSVSSTDKLVHMLEHENIEIVSVAIRSLSKIGSIDALKSILERCPKLLRTSLIAKKTVEAFLLNFGMPAVPVIIEHIKGSEDAGCKASLLEVLSHMRTRETLPVAVENLKSEDAEVRAKALKIIASAALDTEDFDWEHVVALTHDPVWFVRLHAARALGNKKYVKAVSALAKLLRDEKWHVRNAAAAALTQMGNAPLDVFLEVLSIDDAYVRGSVCEEIQKTDYVSRLIENLGSYDRDVYGKSREILEVMRSLDFCTPFSQYLEHGDDEKIKLEVEMILKKIRDMSAFLRHSP
jgi:HEAT repeat protein